MGDNLIAKIAREKEAERFAELIARGTYYGTLRGYQKYIKDNNIQNPMTFKTDEEYQKYVNNARNQGKIKKLIYIDQKDNENNTRRLNNKANAAKRKNDNDKKFFNHKEIIKSALGLITSEHMPKNDAYIKNIDDKIRRIKNDFKPFINAHPENKEEYDAFIRGIDKEHDDYIKDLEHTRKMTKLFTAVQGTPRTRKSRRQPKNRRSRRQRKSRKN